MPLGLRSLHDRFLGCLLGQAVGDAVGAPLEGLSAETIYRDFGPASTFVESPPVDELFYTDDTQMMIGVAECLIECGCVVPEVLIDKFAANYDPARGYGPGARKIFDAMKAGDDWKGIVENVFPGGSLGNGGAMRVAPIGLVFHHDASWLLAQATLSAQTTHRHPIGIDGAAIFARAVSLALTCDEIEPAAFFAELLSVARTEEFQWQLRTAANLPPDSSITYGNSLEAHRSVTSALMCFAKSPENYTEVISRAIGMGNDTDTLAAMAGALAGAHLGVGAIPPKLLDMLEKAPKGRLCIEELATKLYELSLRAAT